MNDGCSDVEKVAADEHEVSNRYDIDKDDIDPAIDIGPSWPQNPFDLLSEFHLVRSVMD